MSKVTVVNAEEVYARARKQREAFYGKPISREQDLNVQWPDEWLHIGKANAQVYYSNKMLSGGKWELYKHIAEGRQELFINTKITSLYDENGHKISFRDTGDGFEGVDYSDQDRPVVYGEKFAVVGEMPKYVSVLASCKGIQWQAPDGNYHEIRIPRAMIASGKHPVTDETFLVVYTSEGVHLLIWGAKLGVTKDGIVG